MDVDPAASMRCWLISVELGGCLYEIPAQPAADWWLVLAGGNLGLLLEDMRDPEPAEPGHVPLDEMLLAGAGIDLVQPLTDAVEEAAGRSLHAALVLAAVAQQFWPEIGGEMTRRGFRWDVQPLGAALDLIYAIVVSGLPEEKDGKRPRDEFLRALEGPGAKDAARQLTDFEAVAGPKPTAAVRSTGAPSGRARSRVRQRPQPPRPDAP